MGTETIKAYNAWEISNSLGLTAHMLNSGADRGGLNKAYASMVGDVVSEVASGMGRRQLLTSQHRKLAASYNPNTAKVYRLVDVECPPSAVEQATCQSVFGRFDLHVFEQDKKAAYDLYVNATQTAIKEGRLQRKLEEVDPGSALYIERATDPQKAAQAAQVIPQSRFEMDKETQNDGGDNQLGLLGIILIAAGCAGVLVAIIAYSTIVPNRKRDEFREKLKIQPDASVTITEEESQVFSISRSQGRAHSEHREEVVKLVKRNCPDQIDNVDALLTQFKGREEILLKTLKGMGDPEHEDDSMSLASDDESSQRDDGTVEGAASNELATANEDESQAADASSVHGSDESDAGHINVEESEESLADDSGFRFTAEESSIVEKEKLLPETFVPNLEADESIDSASSGLEQKDYVDSTKESSGLDMNEGTEPAKSMHQEDLVVQEQSTSLPDDPNSSHVEESESVDQGETIVQDKPSEGGQASAHIDNVAAESNEQDAEVPPTEEKEKAQDSSNNSAASQLSAACPIKTCRAVDDISVGSDSEYESGDDEEEEKSTTNKEAVDDGSSSSEYESSDEEDSSQKQGWVKKGKEWVQDFVSEDAEECDSSEYDSDGSGSSQGKLHSQ